MAIIAHAQSPNFAAGNYHRILRVEMICNPGEPNPRYVVHMGHYFSEQARELNTQPMYVNQVIIPFSQLAIDPRNELYQLVMASEQFAALNPVSDVSTTG
jgi:hypothetical protein